MLYFLFLVLAIVYNLKKFARERGAILSSLVEAKNTSHRQMILAHHYYILVFESFIAVITAHFITEKAMAIGMLGLGSIYVSLLVFSFFVYRIFIKHLEKRTELQLWDSFKSHIIQEVRVNFALIMLPILIYAIINMTFQDGIYEEWGSLWLVGLLFNIIFVSVLTIVCSVIIMLKLIPNREITEPEYLEIIKHRLNQTGVPNLRVRWIETEVKNAFVAGLKLFRFSNQTLFVGKSLRTMLTLEEFDAVICHELSHVANRHIQKRVLDLLKNFLSILIGTGFILLAVIGLSFLYWGEDAIVHTEGTVIVAVGFVLVWFVMNFAMLFDVIRSHEFEADAYAVLKLGVDYHVMKSTLQKLSIPDELPEYLKQRAPRQKKGWLKTHMGRVFSTHPDLESRLNSLEIKMTFELPFNHYLSWAQRMRTRLSGILNWKALVPATASFVVLVLWTGLQYQQGLKTISYINRAPTLKIMARKDIASGINSRPKLLGHTLMYYIVKKGDPRLIEHYLSLGAEKGRTLNYLAQEKNYKLFEKYYSRFQQELSDEEYFLVLRKTAQVHFTEGYRLLVNAKRFETLHPEYKQDIASLHTEKSQTRGPASVKK
jgi:Zn-dependent protease with chaperone function